MKWWTILLLRLYCLSCHKAVDWCHVGVYCILWFEVHKCFIGLSNGILWNSLAPKCEIATVCWSTVQKIHFHNKNRKTVGCQCFFFWQLFYIVLHSCQVTWDFLSFEQTASKKVQFRKWWWHWPQYFQPRNRRAMLDYSFLVLFSSAVVTVLCCFQLRFSGFFSCSFLLFTQTKLLG